MYIYIIYIYNFFYLSFIYIPYLVLSIDHSVLCNIQ